MRRVMIVGQPGAGKSTLARALGDITYLPVVHMNHIHWQAGWIQRSLAEKNRLCAEVHARERWIFEGGHSASWPERLARADTLIWLDFPLWQRLSRVTWRTLRHWHRTRPDLPAGCPEQFSAEFFSYIWRTRQTGRRNIQNLFNQAPTSKTCYRLASRRQVDSFLKNLRAATAVGNLGVPHR